MARGIGCFSFAGLFDWICVYVAPRTNHTHLLFRKKMCTEHLYKFSSKKLFWYKVNISRNNASKCQFRNQEPTFRHRRRGRCCLVITLVLREIQQILFSKKIFNKYLFHIMQLFIKNGYRILNIFVVTSYETFKSRNV